MTDVELTGVTVRYGAVEVLSDVDLSVERGTVLGVVGESGSGKSTLGRVITGLVPVSAGQVRICGGPPIPRRGPRPAQLIFQDPAAALDPRMTVGDSIAEALSARTGGRSGRREREEAAHEYLDLVGLPMSLAAARPRQLSGGQRQRVTIARALAARPKVLVADEITSALDVSVQGSVLNTFREVQRRFGLTVVFVSHNLAVVRYLADRIAVLCEGRVVEEGPTDAVVTAPRHEHTAALLEATPRLPS